ncbi:hypothetical protein B0H16DRAFT_1376371 [Mycena metata]|uniref:Zn(2)-C6 fungal-type domain-containing protein n=1 Tax=Mycena metata TaxID=1033252 RepID=A0AAD7IL45_9AGAR|nr:hypothetical protein B0H16DRAFT_1376371 [Mycena metata]
MSSSATGASKPLRNRPPKPRTEPLRRGKACLNCRHLKIRCDGVRPVCGPCTRVPKDDDCEFTDVSSRTKELQATINRLKARVKELEDPNVVSPAMVLTQPDSPGLVASGSSLWARRSPPTSGSISGRILLLRRKHFLMIIEPNDEIEPGTSFCDGADTVANPFFLDHFLPHASQFGFFMHPDRFRASALLQLPLGHPARPSPAVLCAVYLWGIHLSRSEPLVSYEAIFVRRAQQHISTELADGAHPVHRIHTVQAHILLSTYFLRNKQFLEAEFHTNGAVTLAMGYHLHKIRSSRPSPPPLLGASLFTEVFLDPPRDNIEEGERIRGLWAVIYSQNNLLMTVRTANNLSILESPGLQIDTPWPLDMTEYELGLLPHDLRGSDTVHNFVNREVPGPNNVFALQVQASVLLQQAGQLARRWSPTMQPQANIAYTNATAYLNARVQQFRAGIPPLSEYYDRGQDGRTLAITHALLSAAVVGLHKNGTDTSTICINAARETVTALGDSNIPNFVCAGPVVGALLLLACQVVIREIERLRQFCAGLRSTLNRADLACSQETALLLDLQNGLSTMAIYATDSPLVQYQLTKIQQKCDALGL